MKKITALFIVISLLISNSIAFAENSLIKYERVDGANKKITVNGIINKPIGVPNVSIFLLRPNYKMQDINVSNAKNAIAHMGMAEISDFDGAFQYNFKFSGESGQYTIIAKINSDYYEKTFDPTVNSVSFEGVTISSSYPIYIHSLSVKDDDDNGISKISSIKNQEFTLNNTFKKIKNKEPITVAYIGGSISSGIATDTSTPEDPSRGFKDWSNIWFANKTAMTGVYGVQGGQGSTVHAYRSKTEVLGQNPDLVFLESVVNDMGEWYAYNKHTVDDAINGFEGVIRQIYQNNPNAEIVIVYARTIRDTLNFEENGSVTPTVKAQDELASYYGIPTIDMGMALWTAVKNGELPALSKQSGYDSLAGENSQYIVSPTYKTDLEKYCSVGAGGAWSDGVHPTYEGHVIYGNTITNFLDNKYNDYITADTNKDKSYVMPAKKHENCLSKADILEAWDMESKDFSKVNQPMKGDGSYPWSARYLYTQTKDATISFEFEGSALFINLLTGTNASDLEVTIDGKIYTIRPHAESLYANRGNYSLVTSNLSNSKHTAVLRVLGSVTKSDGTIVAQNNGIATINGFCVNYNGNNNKDNSTSSNFLVKFDLTNLDSGDLSGDLYFVLRDDVGKMVDVKKETLHFEENMFKKEHSIFVEASSDCNACSVDLFFWKSGNELVPIQDKIPLIKSN